MSIDDDAPEQLVLIGYEKLTDHGFTLPCYASETSANAVYVARTKYPGDAASRIDGFEVYEARNLQSLQPGLANRQVKRGNPWLDVFLWDGNAHVGTKAQIWVSIAAVWESVASEAPLSLLQLAEGVPGAPTSDLANSTYAWLQQRHGTPAASMWQTEVYLRGLAIRGLRRRLGEAAAVGPVRQGLRKVRLSLKDNMVTIQLPAILTKTLQITALDLYDFFKATTDFGFQGKIVGDSTTNFGIQAKAAVLGTTLLMRLRKGRGATQTQIPFRVLDNFFGDVFQVKAVGGGPDRVMTLSKSADRRNTMKLQLPEMAKMKDPFARFKRTASGITYQIYDLDSQGGQEIKKLLDAGLENGTTHQTRGAATWWRIL